MNTERNVLVVRKELYLQKLTKLCQNEGWEVYQSTPSILIINAANHSADIHIKYWGAGFWGSVQKGKSLSLTVTPFDYQRSKMFRESKARNGEVDLKLLSISCVDLWIVRMLTNGITRRKKLFFKQHETPFMNQVSWK